LSTYHLFEFRGGLHFASKERDTETGLSYFGARYYNCDLSIWLSVDPMVDKYPSLSPYVYCANNPIKLVDPNGMQWETAEDQSRANALVSKAKNEIGNNMGLINSLMKNRSKNAISNKRKDRLITELIQKNNYLNEGIDNIMSMGSDETETYHFNTIEDNGLAGNVQLREDGVININCAGDEWAWHECVHIDDYRNNPDKWNFNQYGFLGVKEEYFAKSEYKAYRSQYSFYPKGFIYPHTNLPVESLSKVIEWVKLLKFDEVIN